MSTPTSPFASLSLEGQMQLRPSLEGPDPNMLPSGVIRAQAIATQDILSSFDEEVLPSEFRPDSLDRIEQNISKRVPRSSNWTIPGDLERTILQWGAYDEESFQAIRKWQTPTTCAVNFHQKLQSRFKACFEEWDIAAERRATKKDLQEIIRRFKALSNAFSIDQRGRDNSGVSLDVEVTTLVVALDVLQKVCDRGPTDINPSASLFKMLIVDADSNNEPFLLAGIEQFPEAALQTRLGPFDNEDERKPKVYRPEVSLVDLSGLLDKSGAPRAYIERFKVIQEQAKYHRDDVPESAPGRSSGRRSGLEAEPRPGSKRTQSGADATPKRGKRAGGN